MILFLKQNPFVRLLLGVIPGIYLGSVLRFPDWSIAIAWLTMMLCFLFYGLFVFNRSFYQHFSYRWVTGVTLIFMAFLLGLNITQLRITPTVTQQANCYFKGVVNEVMGHNGLRTRAKITTSELKSQSFFVDEALSGQFYIYENDSLTIQPGDIVEGYGRLEPFVKPTIPYQFDFGQYLNRKGISYNFFATKVVVTSRQSLTYIEVLRLRFSDIYTHVFHDVGVQGVIKALVLGDRSDLTSDIRQNFVQAGVIHILAVSGLHVGILFWIVAGMLRFIKRFRYFRLDLILSVLWSYAWLTGFSPSVLRSTIMFSVILLGKELGEKGSLYNSLSISAFFIFLIDPMSLYDAGFWLSHLAVLGMGLYYQPIFNLMKFQFVGWRWIWSMVAVSLAAQITTFPIIIWLFNGFPLYFLLANVLIIPLSPIILGGALLLLALPVGSMVSIGVAFVIEYLVVTMNWLVDFVANLPGAYWSNVSMSALEVALFFIALLFLTLYMGKHYFGYLKWVIYSIGLIFISLTIRFLQAEQTNDLVSKWSKTKGYVNIISRQSNLVVLSGDCRPEDVTAQLIGLWGRRFAENPLFVNCDSIQQDVWRVQIGENQLLWVNRMTDEVEKMIRADTCKWLIVRDNEGRLVEELSHSTKAAQLIWIPSVADLKHSTVNQHNKNVLIVDRIVGSSLCLSD